MCESPKVMQGIQRFSLGSPRSNGLSGRPVPFLDSAEKRTVFKDRALNHAADLGQRQ